MKTCWVVDLGRMGYEPALDWQRRLVQARKRDTVPDVLLLCEHPHVITLGRNGHAENLLASGNVLGQMGVGFHSTDRGGDVTYHGPGQLVGYPILNLAEIRRDVVWYVRQLEEVLIRATAEFGIAATRLGGMTGVWVERDGGPAGGRAAEKLAAIGVHLSRWVTSHGFAYNISTDLRYFELIVPCGLRGKSVTSLERLLGRTVPSAEVRPRIIEHFGKIFGRAMEPRTLGEWEEAAEEREACVGASLGPEDRTGPFREGMGQGIMRSRT